MIPADLFFHLKLPAVAVRTSLSHYRPLDMFFSRHTVVTLTHKTPVKRTLKHNTALKVPRISGNTVISTTAIDQTLMILK